MHDPCHRCGEELLTAPEAVFCPHCGAPQLYLRDYIPSDAGTSPGADPPPNPRQVEWQPAIRGALLVALGGALLVLLASLLPWLSLLSWIWVVSASVIALGIYQKQRPLAWVDAGIGARIGLVVGLAMAAALGVATAITGLLQRFAFKDMATVDAANRIMLENIRQQMAQSMAPNPVPPEFTALFASPEFFAGAMLAGFAVLGTVVVLLSMAGGAFAGMMRTRARA
jgi:hypothetical protein